MRDRGALDAQQLVRDLRDHVAVRRRARSPRARRARAPVDLQVAEGGGAVGVPLRRHAVVAQLVEDVLRLLVARQHLEHPEVERRRAVQQRARVGVDAERGRGPARPGPGSSSTSKAAASTAMNADVEPTGSPTNGRLDAPHALGPAVLLDLVRVGVVVGHEEVLLHRLARPGVRDMPERRRGVDHAVQAARQPLLVGVEQRDAAARDQVAVLRMAEAAGEDADLLGAQLAQDRRRAARRCPARRGRPPTA